MYLGLTEFLPVLVHKYSRSGGSMPVTCATLLTNPGCEPTVHFRMHKLRGQVNVLV